MIWLSKFAEGFSLITSSFRHYDEKKLINRERSLIVRKEKLLSLLGVGLAVCLVKPYLLYANPTFGGGSGTENNPYLISTPEHLTELQVAVDSGNSFEGKYFVLTNDIDFSNYDNDSNPNNGNFDPIGYFGQSGNLFEFSGTLDGKGYAIKHLSIKRPLNYANGLFAYTVDATIKNVQLKEVVVEGQVASAISAYAENTSISQVVVEGNLKGGAAGGLVGATDGSIIENSSFEGKIQGTMMQVGGIASFAKDSRLTKTHFKGNINETLNGTVTYVGGVAGMTESATLEDCHVEGTIRGSMGVGGIAGNLEESSVSRVQFEGNVIGQMTIGGITGMSYMSQIQQSSVLGDVEGETMIGGLAGGSVDSLIEQSFVLGNVEGTDGVGGLIGIASQPLKISNAYAMSEVTGNSQVGGLIGSIDDYYESNEVAMIENSYHDGVVNGTQSTGAILGNLGYDDGDDLYEGSVSFNHIYYNQEKNPTHLTVGKIMVGTVTNEGVVGLTTVQMTESNAKTDMKGFDFEGIWTTTSTTPMFRWQNDLISATKGDIQINGKVETTIANVSIPSTSPNLVIDPNSPDGVISPEFSIDNRSTSPIRLELKTFEQTTNSFNDVLPDKYASWETLNKTQSQDIALGLITKAGEGWQRLTTPISYVFNHQAHEIGVMKPMSQVNFEFEVHHGRAFSEAKTVQYKMVFVFDLLN